MITKVNCEGMTLLEWACAAAVKFTNEAFVSRGSELGPDYSTYRCTLHGHGYFEKSKMQRFTRRRDPYEDGLRKRDVRPEHYAAWEAGEDPSEWRAAA